MTGRRLHLWCWVFLLPTTILYGAYTLYPIVASYWYSLVRWNGFSAEMTFVGLDNYRAVLDDPMFWNSFWITLVFMALVAPARVIIALGFAMVLNSKSLPLSKFFKTVYFLPVVTTTAIVGVVMQFILDPGAGPVSTLAQQLGLGPLDLLGRGESALLTVSVVYVWKFCGITMIYWLAALQSIPSELYEAAKVDGARWFASLRHITLPLLVPFLLIISVLTVEETFRAFDLMQTMTAGGPYFSTEIIEIYIYRWAFAATIPQLGLASAAAVIFGLVVMVVVVFQMLALVARRRMQRSGLGVAA